VWSDKGDNDRAMADFNAALRINPKYAKALYLRGMTRLEMGDITGGAADVASARKIDPKVGS
jgi:tetratricopeptide (TPR) repeat protein